MRPVISAKDIEELLKKGGDLRSLPADALYTPSALDVLRETKSTLPRPAAKSAPSPADGAERLSQSPAVQALKLEICDIGRRLWQRAYVDGNGGNISVRVSDDLVLCTPTLISKGFMKPEDLCLVDLEGNQKAGAKKRTSEILMHLEIMKAQPKARACVHCHPPHSTAFAVAGVKPPTCMIPEIEVFIGEVPIAPYFTPGTKEMAQRVAALVNQHNTILMANHGVVAWSHSVEDAYFKMEILEAYCRTVVVAAQLGAGFKTFTPAQLTDLLQIKQKLGIPDRRIGLKECELCDNSEWRPGVACAAPAANSGSPGPEAEAEALVRSITEMIIAKTQG